MKYNAFISYRHAPLDMEIAKKIHTGLETYKIPKSVKKRPGINKIERVFRDQEELPIGSNLTDNINEALENSEFLIVICSPRTPESEWVQKEIETFISMHGRNNVLAVLIEGEPDESFPKLLLRDETGNSVEPLAANVRGLNKKERNKKYKTEILRLVAPIIGCSYDDLRQRHRDRILKRTITLATSTAAVVAIAGMAFGIYNAKVAKKMSDLADEKALLAEEKTFLADEILKEYRLKQENQSRFFAKEALSLEAEGNREDAVLVAMAALPDENNDRPYVAEAEYALSSVLHAYDVGNTMCYDRTLPHDLTVYEEKLSRDNKYLISKDSGNNIYLWDTETWELITEIAPTVNNHNYLETINDFQVDSEGIYILSESAFIKYDFDGKPVFTISENIYSTDLEVNSEEKEAYYTIDNIIKCVDLENGLVKFPKEMPVKGKFYGKKKLSADNRFYLSGFMKDDSDRIFMSAYDLKNDSFKITKVKEDYILNYCSTGNGLLSVLSCNSDFVTEGVKALYLDLVDPATGIVLWSKPVDTSVRSAATFYSDMKAHKYTYEGSEYSEIVVSVESEAFTFDEDSGKCISSIDLPGETRTLNLRSDNSIGFVGLSNGKIETFDFHKGRIYSDNTIDTGVDIRDICILDGKIAVRPAYSSSIYVMKYHTADDVKELRKLDVFPSVKANPYGSDFFLMGEGEKLSICASCGSEIMPLAIDSPYPIITGFTEDKAIVFSYETMYVATPSEKTVKETPYTELGIESKMFKGFITENGKYAVLMDSRNIYALDVLNGKLLMKASSDTTLGNAIMSEDGKYLYVSATDKNLFKVNVDTKEETFFEDDSLRELSNVYTLKYMTVSHTGNLLAMCCKDGNVRIVDTQSCDIIDTIPFNANNRLAIYFTKDDKNLIMQGDDLKIKIRNIEDKTYVNTIDSAYTMTRPIYGHDNMAICDGAYLYLLNSDDYGVCAKIDGGKALFSSDNSILITTGSKLYSTFYKDYKALLREARKQFPEAKLTEEKRVKYNMN